MSNSWIRKAAKSIREQAEDAYAGCEEIASKQHLELEWVLTVFKAEMNKVIKEKGGESDA